MSTKPDQYLPLNGHWLLLASSQPAAAGPLVGGALYCEPCCDRGIPRVGLKQGHTIGLRCRPLRQAPHGRTSRRSSWSPRALRGPVARLPGPLRPRLLTGVAKATTAAPARRPPAPSPGPESTTPTCRRPATTARLCYPPGLYQYSILHRPRSALRSLLGGLSVPPAHSPPSNWEQPVYTTLTRP